MICSSVWQIVEGLVVLIVVHSSHSSLLSMSYVYLHRKLESLAQFRQLYTTSHFCRETVTVMAEIEREAMRKQSRADNEQTEYGVYCERKT